MWIIVDRRLYQKKLSLYNEDFYYWDNQHQEFCAKYKDNKIHVLKLFGVSYYKTSYYDKNNGKRFYLICC